MSFWSNLVRKFTPGPKEEDIDWEALLMEADLGLKLTGELTAALDARGLMRKPKEAEAFIRGELMRLMSPGQPIPSGVSRPKVLLLVGVNGSGKTTTAAKLAALHLAAGRTVCLGAADTFRAAAVDQLQVWGERLGVPVVSAPQGSDPATVAFQAHERATRENREILIVDTAGRLPNKSNLMQEIAKVKRTLQKRESTAPHETWLVVDGTSGSHVLHQAREFHQVLGLTGLIMTKLDGSAKGGMAAAVKSELNIPTVYLGRGEGLQDLVPFDGAKYVEEFFG